MPPNRKAAPATMSSSVRVVAAGGDGTLNAVAMSY